MPPANPDVIEERLNEAARRHDEIVRRQDRFENEIVPDIYRTIRENIAATTSTRETMIEVNATLKATNVALANLEKRACESPGLCIKLEKKIEESAKEMITRLEKVERDSVVRDEANAKETARLAAANDKEITGLKLTRAGQIGVFGIVSICFGYFMFVILPPLTKSVASHISDSTIHVSKKQTP